MLLLPPRHSIGGDQGVEARYSGLAVPAGLGLGEVRAVGDLVLDPVCGSGTTAAAAARLGRRFIAVDRERSAIDATLHRLVTLQHSGEYRRTLKANGKAPAINVVDFSGYDGPLTITDTWNNGDNYVIQGDALQVLKTMPDSFVSLVYADPPYGSQRDYQGKAGGFSDRWAWDEAAEARLEEIRQLPADATAVDREWTPTLLDLVRQTQPGLASYLTWMTLLMVECRRVMGGTGSIYRCPHGREISTDHVFLT